MQTINGSSRNGGTPLVDRNITPPPTSLPEHMCKHLERNHNDVLYNCLFSTTKLWLDDKNVQFQTNNTYQFVWKYLELLQTTTLINKYCWNFTLLGSETWTIYVLSLHRYWLIVISIIVWFNTFFMSGTIHLNVSGDVKCFAFDKVIVYPVVTQLW